MQPNIVVGVFTGTASTVNVNLGFVPDHVFIQNVTDGDVSGNFWRGTTVGAFIAQYAAGTQALLTSAVEPLSDTTDGLGFKAMGSVFSESGKKFKYVASRSSAGAQNEQGVT